MWPNFSTVRPHRLSGITERLSTLQHGGIMSHIAADVHTMYIPRVVHGLGQPTSHGLGWIGGWVEIFKIFCWVGLGLGSETTEAKN